MSEMPGEVTAKVKMAVEAMAEMVTDAEVTDAEEVNAKVATTTVTVAEASELFTKMGPQVLQLPHEAMLK